MIRNVDHPLRITARPDFESADAQLAVVDLFAGCGGLTLGAAQAAHDRGLALAVPLAVDIEKAAVAVFRENFPAAGVVAAAVEEYVDGGLGADPTAVELATRATVGDVGLLIGGPPCQGHSSLNNHTRRDDPKNALYLRMARAAEVLRPRAMMIENVPAVVHDKQHVVARVRAHVEGLGYAVGSRTVEFVRLGIPQTRRRHLLLAVRDGALGGADVDRILDLPPQRERDLEWAIGDLRDVGADTWFDRPSRMSAENEARMRWLIENDATDLPNSLRPRCQQGEHSYVSMYGRLSWTKPAQTITSGFGSMGQGRYGHPSQPRTLTPHEAARIQGFPDYFRLDRHVSRTQLSVIIGNAVPPTLSRVVTGRLLDEGVLPHHRGPEGRSQTRQALIAALPKADTLGLLQRPVAAAEANNMRTPRGTARSRAAPAKED